MKRKSWIQVFTIIGLMLLVSCGSSTYFYNESANKTYTELELKKDGTFNEAVYYCLTDSLINEDFGNLLVGEYSNNGDTLLLTYLTNKTASSEKAINEIYLKRDGDLIKLAPITYSHHFLNMILTPGKSEQLRELPNYDAIVWKMGF